MRSAEYLEAPAFQPARRRFLLASAEPSLMSAAAMLALAGLGFAMLGIADGRQVAGLSPWVKPMKFSASLSLHLATLALFWPWLAQRFRDGLAGSAVRRLVIAMSVFELTYIGFQASRASGSHYNVAEAFPALMYSLMGVGAVIIVAGTAIMGAAALTVREGGERGVMRRAIGLGLALSGVLGLVTGALLSVNGGHHVGEPSLSASVWPVFGWSREVGDLRIAHFTGLHAAQAIPLVALAALRVGPGSALKIAHVAALLVVATTVAAAGIALSGRAPI
ncbi:MAG: hypothetical protein MEP57_07325 [Microvirga sp.]|nr:hypothetical protein [Microvirga sp.]